MSCTGLTARWCPDHGECICPPDTFERVDCPLHGRTTTHPVVLEARRPAELTCVRCDTALPLLRLRLDRAVGAVQDAAEFVERLATLTLKHCRDDRSREAVRKIRGQAGKMRRLSLELTAGT